MISNSTQQAFISKTKSPSEPELQSTLIAVEFSWTNIFIFRLDESLHWKRLNHVCVPSNLAVKVWAQMPVFLFSYKYEITLNDKICGCSL